MNVQIGYTIGKPLTEEKVREIWRYVQGPLCDLYGAETGIQWGKREYIIERTNMLPLLPKIDKILEITVDDTSTLINCYFARDRWVGKMKQALEKITGEAVDTQTAEWKRLDLERVLQDAKQDRDFMFYR